jgi:large subunit ribosomal protein L21
MYAIIKTGGKQYRVQENDIVTLEKLEGAEGDSITLDHVLMIGGDDDTQIGAPTVDGASVSAEILEQTRDDKIIVFKKKRRKGYRRKKGHRQYITKVKITGIETGE